MNSACTPARRSPRAASRLTNQGNHPAAGNLLRRARGQPRRQGSRSDRRRTRSLKGEPRPSRRWHPPASAPAPRPASRSRCRASSTVRPHASEGRRPHRPATPSARRKADDAADRQRHAERFVAAAAPADRARVTNTRKTAKNATTVIRPSAKARRNGRSPCPPVADDR